MKSYLDFADWWIGYYRGPNHHYVCLLPTWVLRWDRRTAKPEPVLDGEGYYLEHGWSGCAGSAWEHLTQATRDGWEAAARERASA